MPSVALGSLKPRPWPRAGPVAGVDEAGRGPVLGPLVVAGVLAPSERALRALGVKDSKKLTPPKREGLDREIRTRWRVAVVVVENDELDHRMSRASLNQIEVELFADVLRELDAPRAYLDAADVVATRFGEDVAVRLRHAVAVRAEHKADDRRACVAAASIVAKVARDARIERIAADLGCEIGSGYVHDPRTIAWLKAWVAEHGDLPACARRMWAPARSILAESKQRGLGEFTDGAQAPASPRDGVPKTRSRGEGAG